MKIYVLAYIIKVFLSTYVYYLCNACGSGYCSVEQWAPWGSCNASCGGGVQERQKMICCDTFKYHSLKACLQSCNIPFSWWEANATEYKPCGKCQRGGTFDIKHNSCICPSGYGGSCCDIRTTLPTTIKTTTATTKSTTTKTTTKPTTTRTTTKPTTTKTTTKPTTTKTTTKPTTTRTTTPMTTKTTTETTTTKATRKPTTTKTTTETRTTKTTTKPTTTKTTIKPTTTKKTKKPTTTRTTTIPTVTKTTIIPTTTEVTTKPTTTKSITNPSTTKTRTRPTSTKTATIPSTTKTCIKPTTILVTTKNIQPWAIVVISVLCLGIVSTCCFCLWGHVRSYMRKNRVTKIKPAEKQSC